MNKIIKIVNPELFQELKGTSKVNGDMWKALFTDEYELKDAAIPTFGGELDHIQEKEDKIVFHDRGVSRCGKVIDNTFAIVSK